MTNNYASSLFSGLFFCDKRAALVCGFLRVCTNPSYAGFRMEDLYSRKLKRVIFYRTSSDCLQPPKFNSSPLKNGGWNMSFLLGLPIFRGYVKFLGCIMYNCITVYYVSEQIMIIHQPGKPWNKGTSPTKLPFGVRSCEVAIISPDVYTLGFHHH